MKRQLSSRGPDLEESLNHENVESLDLETEKDLDLETRKGHNPEGHQDEHEVDHRTENLQNLETGKDPNLKTGEDPDPFQVAGPREGQFLDQGEDLQGNLAVLGHIQDQRKEVGLYLEGKGPEDPAVKTNANL